MGFFFFKSERRGGPGGGGGGGGGTTHSWGGADAISRPDRILAPPRDRYFQFSRYWVVGEVHGVEFLSKLLLFPFFDSGLDMVQLLQG